MQKEKLKHIAKRITAFAAAVAMAAAFTFPAEVGNGIFKGFGSAIVASAETYTAEYDISAESVTISKDGTYRIYGSTTTNTVLVAKDVSADITLDNVNIDVSKTSGACAFKIEDDSTGNVTIDLVGENTLKSGVNCAGLQKNGDFIFESKGKLTIKSKSGTGKLTATGGENGASIGGGYYGTSSNITISGGTVTATGGEYSAGIGGGWNGTGSDITISGGTVTATGGEYSAGIGGGDSGTGSNITISGGTVTATGGNGGAGIGGGLSGNGEIITISSGTVTAEGGDNGAGIGGGSLGSGSDIKISGGSVKAVAGENANAIGGGRENDAVTPTTDDGTTAVYLREIANPTGADITINDNTYPTNHSGEAKIYAYLPAMTAAYPNEVTVGTTTTKWYYDTANSVWKDASNVVLYTITATAGAGGSISPCGDVLAAANDSQTFTITPDSGYGIDTLKVDGNTVTATKSYTFTNITGDHTISVTFKPVQTYTLTVINGTGSGAYAKGDLVTITADAPETGKQFKEWTVISGNVTLEDSTSSTTTFTMPASAVKVTATYDAAGTTGDFTVTGGTEGTDYSYANNVLTIKTAVPVTISGTTTTDSIVVAKDVSANITLKGVNIDVSGTGDADSGIVGVAAFTIEDDSEGDVTIDLVGENTLKSGAYYAGLQKKGGFISESKGKLTIKSTSGTGKLTAAGGWCCAGIGGSWFGYGSNIEISGGTVTATGGVFSAGIGGGCNGYGSNIEISGGTIIAEGGAYGAGIGGGSEGSGSNITISGGSVYAEGGDTVDGVSGADIGSGIIYDPSSETYSDGVPVTPNNGSAPVYLLEIENSTGAAITINGKTYPTNHNGEAKIYAYLPAKTKSDPNEVIVENTITYCYYDTANSKWIDVNTVVTNTSFDVTASNVIVHYTTADGTELKSQTFTFNEVTVDMVDLMKSQDMQLVIYFVNYSTDGSDTVILTDAQMKAIEYVLEHDLGIAA